ncbi:hypothetical protein NMY22_g4592 [Coprinellus aureogranulatus]|nr:hypothetical protein NMY22_g4592 [Coprinellus aureogranulatus]
MMTSMDLEEKDGWTAMGEEQSRMNREKNLLAPINRLPAEVLAKIFLMSLITSQEFTHPPSLFPSARIHQRFGSRGQPAGYVFQCAQKGLKPDYLKLCHVCQDWRIIALDTSELWTHIEVHTRTKPELLDFIRARTKGLPIILDIHHTGLFRARDAIFRFFSADAGQLRSVAFSTWDWVLRNPREVELFRQEAAPASQLESLQLIIEGDDPWAYQTIQPFSSGAPNLRHFEAKGVIIPWGAAILKSACLTHAILHNTPHIDSDTMRDMISFLRHSPQLKTLLIGYSWGHLGYGEAPKEQGLPSVELPNLERLHIISRGFRPLSLLLKVIRPPQRDLKSVEVICKEESETNLQARCDYISLAEPYISPDHVEIGWKKYEYTDNWKPDDQGFLIVCDHQHINIDQDTGELQFNFADFPWITMNTGKEFPFPAHGSGLPRVPWSFDTLRHIAFGDGIVGSIPGAFWAELGALQTLEMVQFKRAEVGLIQPFLVAMAGEDESMQEGRRLVTTRQSFPALRALLFESMNTVTRSCLSDLRQLGCDLPEVWDQMDEPDVYLRFVASQLLTWKNRVRRPLDRLCFHGKILSPQATDMTYRQSSVLEAVDEEVVKDLRQSAKRLVLGSQSCTSGGDVVECETAEAPGEVSQVFTAQSPSS